MDETACEAEAQGLTPEILDDILHDRPPSAEELAGSDEALPTGGSHSPPT